MSDPLSVPFPQWPERDRLAWERATAVPDSLFAASSSAAKLRPRTLACRLEVYSLWLSFLARRGALDPHKPVALTVTPELRDAFIAEQQQRDNNNGVIVRRIGNLRAAFRMLAPAARFDFLVRINGLALGRALPHKPRRVPVRDSRDLLCRTLALYQAGCQGKGYAKGMAAIRDAAILGILVTRAPRVGSMAVMEIGHHLRMGHSCYRVSFGEVDQKTGGALSYDLDDELTPILDEYLGRVRPAFGGAGTAKVWLGTKRRALNAAGIAEIVRRHTRDWYSEGRGPHWLRKCLTTTVALETPELMHEVALVLDHTVEVGLTNYNMATAVAAAGRHGHRIARLKLETAPLAEVALRREIVLQAEQPSGLLPKAPVRRKIFGSLATLYPEPNDEQS